MHVKQMPYYRQSKNNNSSRVKKEDLEKNESRLFYHQMSGKQSAPMVQARKTNTILQVKKNTSTTVSKKKRENKKTLNWKTYIKIVAERHLLEKE